MPETQIERLRTEASQLRYPTRRLLGLMERDDDGDMADMLLHLLEIALPTGRAYDEIMTRHQGPPVGIEFEHHVDQGRYACVLPDASKPGQFRVQYFDANGFSSHDTVGSAEQAVEQMVTEGFRKEDPAVMTRLAKTRTWSIGCAVTALMQKLNTGQLPWDDFLRQRDALYAGKNNA